MGWGVKLHCEKCGRGKVIEMPIKETERWPPCDVCGDTSWRPADRPDDQRFPYRLNHNDIRFLHSIRVDPDE